jgi:hypothetical protein
MVTDLILNFSGNKMSSARGNNNSISCNAYAQQRIENIEKNKRKLAALNIPIMAQQVQPRKKQKVCCKNLSNGSLGSWQL